MSRRNKKNDGHPGHYYYGEQDENGIDLSLIRENLKLTPLERIRRAEALADETVLLVEYGRRHHENQIRENRPASS
jgi:hypothetical protein